MSGDSTRQIVKRDGTLLSSDHNPEQSILVNWHGKHLPQSMVSIESEKGQKLLQCATHKSSIIMHHVNQVHRKYCEPCSFAISINYLNMHLLLKNSSRSSNNVDVHFVDYNDKKSIDENDVRYHPKVATVFQGIDEKGITLCQLWKACVQFGISCKMLYATRVPATALDSSMKQTSFDDSCISQLHTVSEFREVIKITLQNHNSSIVVNYDMGMLGYIGLRGHFSPIGAYDDKLDVCLILDVWPDTPVAWVPVSSLFNAMATIDPDSKQYRGCLKISKDDSC